MPDKHPMLRAKFLLLGASAAAAALPPEPAWAAAQGETIDVPPNPLHGVIAVGIHVSPEKGVQHVNLFVDGTLLGSDPTLPYAFVWDTTTVRDGQHELRAEAVYKGGRRHQGHVHVVVDNANGTATVFPSLTLYPAELQP